MAYTNSGLVEIIELELEERIELDAGRELLLELDGGTMDELERAPDGSTWMTPVPSFGLTV